jgi:hypothetical protein
MLSSRRKHADASRIAALMTSASYDSNVLSVDNYKTGRHAHQYEGDNDVSETVQAADSGSDTGHLNL